MSNVLCPSSQPEAEQAYLGDTQPNTPAPLSPKPLSPLASPSRNEAIVSSAKPSSAKPSTTTSFDENKENEDLTEESPICIRRKHSSGPPIARRQPAFLDLDDLDLEGLARQDEQADDWPDPLLDRPLIDDTFLERQEVPANQEEDHARNDRVAPYDEPEWRGLAPTRNLSGLTSTPHPVMTSDVEMESDVESYRESRVESYRESRGESYRRSADEDTDNEMEGDGIAEEPNDGSLILQPHYCEVAINRLHQECPRANLAGGNTSFTITNFTSNIISSTTPRNGEYVAKEVYTHSKLSPGYGRRYNFTGAQGLKSSVRNLVLRGYEDLDMENAQPTVMAHLMNIMGYEGPGDTIDYYIHNRADCLCVLADELGISKADAKGYFIKTGFSMSVDAWQKAINKQIQPGTEAHKIAFNWDKQIKDFMDWLWDMKKDEFSSHDKKTDAQIIKDGQSIKYRRVSLFLQDEEQKIIMLAIAFMQRFGSVGALMHDGIYVRVPGGAAQYIERLQQHIADETGYEIKFTVKPPKTTITLDELIEEHI